MRNPLARHIEDRSLLDSVGADARPLSQRDRQHLAGCQRCHARLARFTAIEVALRGPWTELELSARPIRSGKETLMSFVALGVSAVVLIVAIGARSLVAPAAGSPAPKSTARIAASSAPSPTGPFQFAGPIGGTLAWRPDGSELLISGQEGTNRIDPHGNVLESIPGAEAASWVDNDHFAIWRGEMSTSSVGTVEIRALAGTAVAVSGTYTFGLLGDGKGDVALVPATIAKPGGNGTFVVWSSRGTSDPIDGVPLGWANDGGSMIVGTGPIESMGADIQQVALAVATFPGPQVRAIPGVRADPKYQPAFSPDGSLVALSCATLKTNEMCGQVVVDLKTGVSEAVAHQPIGLPLSWLPGDRLLLSASSYPDPGPMQAWSGTALAPVAFATGSSGIAAETGAIATSTEHAGSPSTVTIYSAAGSVIASSPGAGVSWSPDGRTAAILPNEAVGKLILVPIPEP